MTDTMRLRALSLLLVAGTAHADTFGGFSAVDRPYLVNQDRACVPLLARDGAATGAPSCSKVAADVLAHLDVKAPIAQRGGSAVFAASASGRTLTVKRAAGGDVVVAWDAPDPIGKIVEVYAAHDEDRVAVAYTVRRAGRELTDVVAFDLNAPGARPGPVTPGPTVTPPAGVTPPVGGTAPAVTISPEVSKAVAAARKAPTPKAAASWQAVLALDADHAEARYRLAAIAVAAKKPADALALLGELAKSRRPDANEYLVEARFDPAFASLRAVKQFRDAVGLDRKPATAYEHFMGFGGQWEQTGTPCDKAEVHLVALRDRTFKLRVKTACEGQIFDLPFHGVWRTSEVGITLRLPTTGAAATDKDDAPCTFEAAGDEDALHCVVGKDIEFTVLPTRR